MRFYSKVDGFLLDFINLLSLIKMVLFHLSADLRGLLRAERPNSLLHLRVRKNEQLFVCKHSEQSESNPGRSLGNSSESRICLFDDNPLFRYQILNLCSNSCYQVVWRTFDLQSTYSCRYIHVFIVSYGVGEKCGEWFLHS